MISNLLRDLPSELPSELFETLVAQSDVRIERILSQGHTSPPDFWYDQDENEWVVVLQGAAEIAFDDGEVHRMMVGDQIYLPAHRRHRVAWSSPNEITIWLAVFWRAGGDCA